ncbi:MAG: hypothetical protein PHW34_14070 [Hespellia sp.]|nr:hypothetical protein [Hespellia sp.]
MEVLVTENKKGSYTVNVLREELYRINGFDKSIDHTIDLDDIELIHETEMHISTDDSEKDFSSKKESDHVSTFAPISKEYYMLLQSISEIAQSISIFSGYDITVSNVRKEELDKCIGHLYKKYIEKMPIILDRILAVTIKSFFTVTLQYQDLELNLNVLIKLFEIALDCINQPAQTNRTSCVGTESEVNICNIEIGQVYKNYADICDALGEPECGGNSKKGQLNRWKRYFKFEKKGYKFIVLDIYDEPLPKNDGRKNRNIYVRYIELILLSVLSQQKDKKYVLYITKNQLWRLLGMINDNYKNIPLDALNEEIPEFKISTFEINKFYQRCNQKLTEILDSSLRSLEDRCLIRFEKQTIIVYKLSNGKLKYIEASDAQKKSLLKAEYRVLKDMKIDSKNLVYIKFKEKEFYQRLSSYLDDWFGWDYTYNRIKIIYNKSDVIEAIERERIELAQMCVNEKVVNALNINAENMVANRLLKSNKEWEEKILAKYSDIPIEFAPTKEDLKIFDYPPLFVEIQRKLADKLIAIKKNELTDVFADVNKTDMEEMDKLFKL